MPCFTFYIFNRKGACQYYHEWQVGGGWVVWLAGCLRSASVGRVRVQTAAHFCRSGWLLAAKQGMHS